MMDNDDDGSLAAAAGGGAAAAAAGTVMVLLLLLLLLPPRVPRPLRLLPLPRRRSHERVLRLGNAHGLREFSFRGRLWVRQQRQQEGSALE